MDKKAEEPQEHGCPAKMRCNHPLIPGTTATMNDGKKSGNSAVAVLVPPLMLVCLVTASALPFIGIPSPKMSSKLQSFSVSPWNNSSSSKCDAVLSVKKNNALCKELWVDLSRASVVYRGERIWEKVMEPFYLREEEEIMIRVNMSAGAALWQRVGADFAAEKSRNGTLELEFAVDAIGMDEDEREKITIEILCRELKVGFRSDSEAAQLIDGSGNCNTKWLGD